jgi:DNA-binding IclR family transcriptional regulator
MRRSFNRLQFCARAPYRRKAKGVLAMLNEREKILDALREKPLKVYEVMRRANIPNEEACQSLLMKMRSEGSVKFDIHKGRWHIG